jgi:2',3'-cyclic-nucleotide 2'-phosphodiesterase / 3'-nucleotidase
MSWPASAAKPLGRRSVLKAAGGLAASVVLPAVAAEAEPLLRLRLLETSDLHMFIYDYDYYRDRPDETVGLAKTATLIDEARAQAKNSLLFDNGDIIQGNPLGDYLAGHHSGGAVHPMFRAMNLLGYDAATLGNHEFNYGLDFLQQALAGADFPFVCANLDRTGGASFLPPSLVLEREFTAEDGGRHRLKIGMIGFLPPQIMVWDKSNLADKVTTQDIVEAATAHVPALRAQCDLVVALCHSGISATPRAGGDENAALYLAQVPGIDVIFTGHQHRVFPGPDYAGLPGVDAGRGTLNGVPAVMPGFWGSHLGIIDLALRRRDGRWTIADFTVEARPIYRRDGSKVTSLAAPETRLLDAAAPEQQATLIYMSEPIGRTEAPITSFFALVGDDPPVDLINRAQSWYAAPLIAATPHAGLPILSAAAPFKAGGLPGPENYTEINAGPFTLRDVADLYIYPNTLRAVRIVGAQVKEWLERSAALFNRIDPENAAIQPLIDPTMPSYDFDVISGVTYAIDVTRPARYDGAGKLIDATAERIVDLRYDGKPIDPAQAFIVATNNYRAGGGGHFPGLDGSTIVLEAPDTNREVIQRYIAEHKTIAPPIAETWHFATPARKVTVSFDSAPNAATLLPSGIRIRAIGPTDTGFLHLALELG